MIVSMWMTRDLVTIKPDTPITEAAFLMARKHIRRLPIVEQHANTTHLVGIITATDILHAYPPEVNPFAILSRDGDRVHVKASDIMSRSLQTVTPETPIEDAARIMQNRKISTLLVLQKDKLVGLITESDIFRAFLGILESKRGDVRITFEIKNNEDIFGMIAPIALRLGVRVVSLMSLHQDDRKLCVVRISGGKIDAMLSEIWNSGHTVLNVLHMS
jgi:acetoin utilization protein AcuB